VFNGILESIDEDGYAVLRFDNSIISFMSKGEPFELGSYIEITVPKITFFSFEY